MKVSVASMLVLGVVFLGGVANTAEASPILEPVAVSSASGSSGGGFALVNSINQSGLSAGYTSGVTDFATYTAVATHSSPGGGTNSGFTNSGGAPQQFAFDLGSVFSLDALAFWATANIGTVTQFTLFADTDNNFANGTTSQIGGVFNVGSLATPASAQVLLFPTVSTRFVQLNVLNMAGGPSLIPGIGEVAFRAADAATVPEPASLMLLGTGLTATAALVRRRRSTPPTSR
jgi:hypothetical protein